MMVEAGNLDEEGYCMYGSGKSRSKFGKFVDLCGITEEDLGEASGLDQALVSAACNDDNAALPEIAKSALVAALRELSGKNVIAEDFWP